MWLADLGSRSIGRSIPTFTKHWNIFFASFSLTRIIRLIHFIAGNCPPSDWAARIGPAQGSFCTVQMFGAGTHQIQGCAAGLLQSVSKENVLWKSSHGPRHYSAELSSYRQRQSGMLVCCSCSLLLLWPTLDPSTSIVLSFQPWKHMMILKMVIMYIIHIMCIMAFISIIAIILNYFV